MFLMIAALYLQLDDPNLKIRLGEIAKNVITIKMFIPVWRLSFAAG